MTSNPHFLSRRLEWTFPATFCHEGIPLSNGILGALIWGEQSDLRVTINRADYWDHRGGMNFNERTSFGNLKHWLQTGDEQSLREAFEDTTNDPSCPPRPTRLPMGRIDLQVNSAFTIESGGLNLGRGEACIELRPGGVLRGCILRDEPVLALSVRGTEVIVTPTPVYHEEVLEYYRQYGFPPAQEFSDGNFSGWVQECPGEPAMCVGVLEVVGGGRVDIWVCSVFAKTPEEARDAARDLLQRVSQSGYDKTAEQVSKWWRDYWRQSAQVTLPDSDRELLYYLGMYKLAGLSWPGGPAATLQGPWVEEYRMPPWSGDYHFNINLQECYWPCYAGNQLQALEPLVKMLKEWEPLLRHNAEVFAGITDGIQLPHAVDDRGTCMGGFWTGSIDHGSTAWTGQLLWLYYRYSQDEAFLREVAYPFLRGAMRVYEAMLEDDGECYSLPVSVSPEFGGAEGNAWGRNASFQLANIHFLCAALIDATHTLGVDGGDRVKWQDIHDRLPLAATDEAISQIYLWEGQPLTESHRHHSHLAGLYPFDIYDLHEPEQVALLTNSLLHWISMGMGSWTGWCLPWAAILFGRTGNGEMADVVLGLYRRLFMTSGYASTHDAVFSGFTVWSGRPRIMQVEACLGACAAIMEMLLFSRRGVLHVFPAVPAHWRSASFEGIRAEGAFLVSAWREEGVATRVEVHSEAGCELVLKNPFGGAVSVRRDTGRREVLSGETLHIPTTAGEKLLLRPN